MLDNKGFDLWADNYDESVGLSDENDSYPFAGYKNILNKIFQIVLTKERARILDIGFGTGVLTSKLYEHGCEIWGQDFSDKMVEIAGEKMPNAHLFRGDIHNGLVSELIGNTYDFIIATYSLHHLNSDEKIPFLHNLLQMLSDSGSIIIGDVAFETEEDQVRCMKESSPGWDKEEFYFVYDEIRMSFPKIQFERVSHCAGIFTLKR